MSSEIDPVTSAAWDCIFPCQATIRSELGAVPQPTRPCYFMIPRLGYLFQSVRTVVEHYYGDLVPYNDTGFLSFLLVSKNAGGELEEREVSFLTPFFVLLDQIRAVHAVQFPVQLVLRIDPTPPSTVVSFKATTADTDGFKLLRQAQKQATFIMYGAVKPFLLQEPYILDRLENSVRKNDPVGFFSAKETVSRSGHSHVMTSNGKEQVPFIFYVNNSVARRAVNPVDYPSLGDVLKAFVPCFADLSSADELPPAAMGKVFLWGIEPFLSTPTEFLLNGACAVDFAVHVVVAPKGGPALGGSPLVARTPKTLQMGDVNLQDSIYSPKEVLAAKDFK